MSNYYIKEALAHVPHMYRINGYISTDGKEFLCRLNECAYGHYMVAYLDSFGRIDGKDYPEHIKVEVKVCVEDDNVVIDSIWIHSNYVDKYGDMKELGREENKYFEGIVEGFMNKLVSIINSENPIGNFENAVMFDGEHLFEYNVHAWGWFANYQWGLGDYLHSTNEPSTLEQRNFKTLKEKAMKAEEEEQRKKAEEEQRKKAEEEQRKNDGYDGALIELLNSPDTRILIEKILDDHLKSLQKDVAQPQGYRPGRHHHRMKDVFMLSMSMSLSMKCRKMNQSKR